MEGAEHGKELSRQRFVAGVVGILGSVISATIGFLSSPGFKKTTDTVGCHWTQLRTSSRASPRCFSSR